MEIKPPANNLHTATTQNASTVAKTNLSNSGGGIPVDWKVEQIIKAVITQITDKQLLLNIQGTNASTPRPAISDLQTGDILKLQVEHLKPMPQFRIVSLQKAANTDLISRTLKNIVAQNTALTPLLKNISFIATSPALRPSPLSVEVNAAVRDLFKQLPAPFNLKTLSQVKNQLQNSGIFIESKIKQHIFSSLQNTTINKPDKIKTALSANLKSTLALDLGAQLYRLAALIRTQLTPSKNIAPLNQAASNPANGPVENKITIPNTGRIQVEQASLQNITQREEAMQTFLRQIESSLTHLQQTQLQNLNESQPGRPLWLMELPIKDGQNIDLFELRISEDESRQTDGETKKTWNVTLKFDLAGLGKIKAHIKVQNELISTQFFSERKEVLTLFRENFGFLRNRLNYNGLNVGNIECTHAKLSDNMPPVNVKRLDERT